MPRHALTLPRFAHAASGRLLSARHARSLRHHELRRRLLTSAVGIVVFLVSSVGFAYSNLQGNVGRHDIDELVGTERPTRPDEGEETPEDPQAGQALNILVIGSDVRTEEDAAEQGVTGMRGDATMIAHVSADRSRVEVVSIPRDTLVDIPSCTLPDGTETGKRFDQRFNSAFAIGGSTGDVAHAAACTLKTVESLTGVYIDDFVVVDFAGFEAMVDALGGVPMYIPEPVDDERAHVVLEQGCQVLDGDEALGYARARYSFKDGSDISRIGRQQELVAAIVREALSKNLLTEMPALYRFLDASTKTLTTGDWIGQLPNMAGLANSLRGIDPEGIRFATMPFEWAGPAVVPTAEAETVWENLRNDRPIDADITGTGEEPTEEATTEEPTTEEPTTEEPTTQQPTETPSAEETTPVCTG
ncbi:LCP family protein [Georgenia halophila]|uniref:LCP family protein n=1 Tax=Georgenia halophila TaxID=620889 RepID=A0ABP8L2Q0_9MICO